MDDPCPSVTKMLRTDTPFLQEGLQRALSGPDPVCSVQLCALWWKLLQLRGIKTHHFRRNITSLPHLVTLT